MHRRHQLIRGQRRLAHPFQERTEGQNPRAAGGAGQFHLRPERQQRRHPVRGGGGIAEIAGNRPRVLDLHAAHGAGCLFQTVKAARQIGPYQIAPGGGRADAPAVRGSRYPAQTGNAGQVKVVAGVHALARCGKDIRAAGDDPATGFSRQREGRGQFRGTVIGHRHPR